MYFQKTKTIVRNKEKNIAIHKSASSKQKQTTALHQDWRWAFKFWSAGLMVSWCHACLLEINSFNASLAKSVLEFLLK